MKVLNNCRKLLIKYNGVSSSLSSPNFNVLIYYLLTVIPEGVPSI